MNDDKIVTLSVGGGGREMQEFIASKVFKKFNNDILSSSSDSAILDMKSKLAFTTDSFIITPEFFTGGDIGKLSVCGTVNDLAVSGAIPKYLSLSLIIPEGYSLEKLDIILSSISTTSEHAGVKIVTGDTKVMPYGKLDSILINTSGIGEVVKDLTDFSNIKVGDKVIVTSDIARHGMSIMLSRSDLGFIGDISSDCTTLNKMLQGVYHHDIKFGRDATRGGIGAVLNEIKDRVGLGFSIDETKIPIRNDVRDLCSTLGFDPLSVANEGVAVLIVSADDAEAIVYELNKYPEGVNASITGSVVVTPKVVLNTKIGGKRYVEMPTGELLPRIC